MAGERAQYVTLGVGGGLYAAPVERVQEILDLRPLAPVPRSPAALLGMIDLRGGSVPVFDLRRLMDLPPGRDDAATRILVLRGATDDDLVGLKADRVFEVAALDADRLEPAPDAGQGDGFGVVAGIGRRDGAFVMTLDLERLLAGLTPSPRARGMPPGAPPP